MNIRDVRNLLVLAMAADGREESEAEAQFWLMLLEPYDPVDAAEALKQHYREESRRAMPADLIRRMDEWRDQWENTHRGGPKPPGWPAAREATISGEELGRRVVAAGGWEAMLRGQTGPMPAITDGGTGDDNRS